MEESIPKALDPSSCLTRGAYLIVVRRGQIQNDFQGANHLSIDLSRHMRRRPLGKGFSSDVGRSEVSRTERVEKKYHVVSIGEQRATNSSDDEERRRRRFHAAVVSDRRRRTSEQGQFDLFLCIWLSRAMA